MARDTGQPIRRDYEQGVEQEGAVLRAELRGYAYFGLGGVGHAVGVLYERGASELCCCPSITGRWLLMDM